MGLLALSVTLIVLLSGSVPLSRVPLQPPPAAAVVAHMKPELGSACKVTVVPIGTVIALLAALAPFGRVVLAGLVTARLHQESKSATVSVAVVGLDGGGGGVEVPDESGEELQLAKRNALARATTVRIVMRTRLALIRLK
jgi:hypothetical protein